MISHFSLDVQRLAIGLDCTSSCYSYYDETLANCAFDSFYSLLLLSIKLTTRVSWLQYSHRMYNGDYCISNTIYFITESMHNLYS